MNADKHEELQELIYFKAQWKESVPEAGSRTASLEAETLLLLLDEEAAEGAGWTEELGASFKVITAVNGSSFQRIAENRYTIDPLAGEDYLRLLDGLAADSLKITSIAMLGGGRESGSRSAVPDRKDIYSIFHLAKAYAARRLKWNFRWVCLSDGTESGKPSAAGAYAESLERLYPRLRFTHVELGDGAGSPAEIIRRECRLDGYGFAREVRYENGVRYEKRFKELAPVAAPAPLRRGGVYLITGGSGALGMLLGGHLARNYGARLVLAGRRPIDADLQDLMRQWEQYGAEAMYVSCDIADPAGAARLVREATDRFGRLHGVIHAAGQASRQLLFQKTEAEFREILRPKIDGILALDEATQSEPLDFFAAFSSTSSVLGDFGQCDYAVANRWVDRFLRVRNRLAAAGVRQGRSVSINWPLWESGGMHLDSQAEQLYLQTSGMGYLSDRLGLAAFEAALSLSEPQVAIIYGKRSRLEALLRLEAADAAQNRGGATELEKESGSRSADAAVSMEESLARDVRQLAAAILQTQPNKLDMHENMGDFGFDSISLKEFADGLSERYDVELSPAVFFAKTTLQELSSFMLEEFPQELEEYYGSGSAEARQGGIAAEGSMREQEMKEAEGSPQGRAAALFTAEPVRPAGRAALQPLGQKFAGQRKSSGSAPQKTAQAEEVSVETGSAEWAAEPAAKKPQVRDVAVIGMSFKLPGADTEEELWRLLENQENHVAEIPEDRWDWRAYYSADPQDENKTNSRWGGFIRGHDEFDARFFQLSPREAELMDPQHRLFIQAVWRAVEDSGCRMSRLGGKRVGVFAGVQFSDYQQLLSAHMDKAQAQSSIGNATALLSNRVSFMFNFKGPSETIDTACSSSLVALHRAFQSVRHGESELAIAGGVSLMLDPNTYVGAGVMGVFSPDGKCKTFDSSANGYVKGEGVGVVVLKPLDKAVEDGDPIYGVIKGTSENHGGRGHSLTAPNSDAQAELLLAAYTDAAVDPQSVTYIETHGTGTELGDPVEINGLKKAFSELYRRGSGTAPAKAGIALGAFKTNIGHLEPASGIAGLIKVLSSMKHAKLPGNLHFNKLNPYIQLEHSPFYILDGTRDWPFQTDEAGRRLPRCAGVSSFGFGGTNAHAVVQEYVPGASRRVRTDMPSLIVLSAKNADRLKAYARELSAFLARNQGLDLSRIACTLQTGREEMEERLAFAAVSLSELCGKLDAYAQGLTVDGLYTANTRRLREEEDYRAPAAAFVAAALEAADCPALAQIWTAGGEIRWEQLYDGTLPPRLSLPAYPFAPTRYWMPQGKAVSGEASAAASLAAPRSALHALIDANTSTLYEQEFTKTFAGDEFYLADHGHVLPGVVYLEMARAAGGLADRMRTVQAIRSVVWSNPIIVGEEKREIKTALRPGDQGVDFQVYSGEAEERTVHAQGKLDFATAAGTPPETMDIPALIASCQGGRREAEEYYELLGTLGAELGGRFRGIEALYCRESEAITSLAVPDSLAHTLKDYALHPTLTDGGLQSAVAYAYRTGLIDRQVLFVPFVLGRLDLYDSSAKAAYAHVRQSGGKSLSFDISFLDGNGRIIAKMSGLAIRPFQAAAVAGAIGQAEGELVYLAPVWKEAPVAAAPRHVSMEKETLIVIGPSVRPDTKLGDWFSGRVIKAGFGAGFRAEGPAYCRLDPVDADSCSSLFEAFRISAEDKLRLVYVPDDARSRTVQELIENQVYPVFHLCRWLAAAKLKLPAQLYVLYRDSETVAAYSALAGFFRSIALESAKLQGRVIRVADLSDMDRVLEQEMREESNPFEVKIEQGIRLCRTLAPAGTGQEPTPKKLQTGGAYLITGGLGGVGYIFARHLAKRYQARLVLCGRSPQPDEAKLRELQALGADVRYAAMDVSVAGEAQRAIRLAKEAYGRLDGIFHCAGVIRDALLTKKSIADMAEVLLPKVYGTLHLYEAMEREEPGLFVPFSTSTSLIGNIGQGDYAYANSFMDHLVADMNAKLGRSDTVLNWSLWKNGGMRVEEQTERLLFTKFGMTPLTDEQGVAAFEESLAHRGGQLMIAAGSRDKLLQAFAAPVRRERPRAAEAVQAAGAAPGREAASRLADAIIGIMAGILKMDQEEIGRHSDIGELGFDSISFTELANGINRAFGLELAPTLFFERVTPLDIAESICADYPEAVQGLYGTASAEKAQPVQTAVSEAQPQTGFRTLLPGAAEGRSGENFAAVWDSRHSHDSRDNQNSRDSEAEPIAIVGISAAMPGADNLDEFWDNLLNKRDMVTLIPEDRWSWRDWFGDPGRELGTTNIRHGAFMKDVDAFDPLFFGIAPAEAEKMDPQERLMLQTVWHTLENAGYKPEKLAGTRTSVFVGVSNGDYQELLLKDGIPAALTKTMLTNRISYFFNWSGPSEPVDTACSSSLVAIHRAVESIRHDGCEYAVAGGINVMASPNLFVAGSSMGMLSPDGKCKTFDKDANGYVRGEGAGALLLKPLSAAVRDKDHIHGVIRGTAVNHGGRSNSVTSPNASAQSEVIIRAFEKAGVDPSTVTYIETHGTGTSLGDPIEVEGLKKAFKALYRKWGKEDREQPQCVLGSVKTNVGHLESAAGMAGISKVLLAMKHGAIPANLHMNELNPYIKLEGTGLTIPAEALPWDAPEDENGRSLPRRAGLSSFGVGGSNAHIIVEEYIPPASVSPDKGQGRNLVILSAKSRTSLRENVSRLHQFVGRLLEERVADAGTADRTDAEKGLKRELARIFGEIMLLDPGKIDLQADLEEYGLDPVKGIRLAESLMERYQVDLRDSVFAFPSLESMAVHLLKLSGPEQYAAVGESAAANMDGAAAEHSLTFDRLAYTLQTGRAEMSERVAVVADSLEGLHRQLEAYLNGRTGERGVYEGQSSQRSPLGRLFDEEEARQFVSALLHAGKWDKIAQLWVQGVAIDWTSWYGESLCKLPLPGYAFEKERYWLPGIPLPANTAAAWAAAGAQDGLEEQELDDGMLLELLGRVHDGEISAETLNLLVGDLLK